ncbi:hypothetical protein IAI10_16950 [Clostridium sp. 19966]|uniref:permease prefix domain 1-containing protein n=1 Tax=Clostridium sp. 19966 TaxID=2768166 RepID=UPI0028DF9E26|nr:permease prefix domain 1-containing protein [Clostridium sp. 19966]MDT8718357.1 hypothetical protein [Clostridium sp. 19966]
MYEKLRRSVDRLFENAPRTKKVNDLKEELFGNLIEKYDELVRNGRSEDEAVSIVMGGVGDIDELLAGLREEQSIDYEMLQKDREKRAFMLSICIGIYIMSVVVEIFGISFLSIDAILVTCIMLTMDTIASCMLVYQFASRPKYKKRDDSIVEEFKEWKYTTKAEVDFMRSLHIIIAALILAVYFIISFAFNSWAFSWIIFIIGFALDRITVLALALRR